MQVRRPRFASVKQRWAVLTVGVAPSTLHSNSCKCYRGWMSKQILCVERGGGFVRERADPAIDKCRWARFWNVRFESAGVVRESKERQFRLSDVICIFSSVNYGHDRRKFGGLRRFISDAKVILRVLIRVSAFLLRFAFHALVQKINHIYNVSVWKG